MTLEDCQALEQGGKLDQAYQSYLSEGFVDDAARMLVSHGRGGDAAALLLSEVAKLPTPLDDAARARAVRAARLFEDNGRAQRAIEVLAWAKEPAALLECALRIAEQGMAFEGGIAVARYGEAQKAPALLMRTAKSDPRYGEACIEMVRSLGRGAELTMQVDRWFADFIRRGPDNDAEGDAFYALATLYAKKNLPENASEVLGRLVARKPGYKDAAAQKEKFEESLLGSSDVLAKVLNEDEAFESAAKSPKTSLPATPLSAAAESLHAVVDSGEQNATVGYAPGATVSKRYQIIDVLGRGGMSIVYKALDLELNETLALKLFTQPSNEEAIERFKQEVKLARQLIHENIIRVYDLGTAHGARYLTMEMLVGEDLHVKMTRGISLRDGCDLLAQACAGLEVAHRLDVVHRDIKPENLFVTDRGVMKVMDFGIAKQTKQVGVTLAGMVVGTPEYMAPEQAQGQLAVTTSADLYSIGIILYAMCTGHLPFRHPELLPLLMMHVQQQPEPPRQKNPGCPADVERLVLDLLQKNPHDRPPSAKAVELRLRQLRTRGIV